METPPDGTTWEGVDSDGMVVDGMMRANQDLVTAHRVPQVPSA